MLFCCGSGCRNTTISPRRGSRYGNSGPTHEALGANCTRFTKTWSPISRVSSIELEGISKACTTNVMMNSPVTSTAASEERNSTVVSRGLSSTSTSFFALPSFFATVIHPSRLDCRTARPILAGESLIHQPQCPVPARDLKNVGYRISKMRQAAGYRVRPRSFAVSLLHRPVNQKRTADNICFWHEPPIPAVVAVVPIISHHKIISLGNNQLPILDELSQLDPPLRCLARRHVQPRKTIAEGVIRRAAEVRVGVSQ